MKEFNAKWRPGMIENSFFSDHILERYLGEDEPKYHVLRNPDGEGWVIGQFYTFTGEYVPLEEEDEERLIFPSAEEAMHHVDVNLEKVKDR